MGGSKDPGRGEPPGTTAPAEPPEPGEGRANRQEEGNAEQQVRRQLSQDSYVAETPPSQEDDSDQAEPGATETATKTEEDGGTTEGHPGDGSRTQDQSGQDDSKPAPQTPHEEPEMLPNELFDAVVAAMQETPHEPPREAWMSTVAELFAVVHDLVTINEGLVPTGKQRYPKLHGDEKYLLYKFFEEACTVSECTYAKWVQYATAATEDLYNTSWSFKHIMQNMTSKVKWAQTKPLNQWAAKVKAGTPASETERSNLQDTRTYQGFMFNPAVYSKTDIEILRAICAQPVAARIGRRLRDGTDEEWKIISGMAEGRIVCRKMPAFLKSVLDSKERLRLYATIQKQVEGELVLQLRYRTSVRVSRQSTRALKEDILLAAEGTKVNQVELVQMLHLAKTVSYNPDQRSVHFFFFDRGTARKFALTVVPFKGTVYRLANMHGPDSGSVWECQLGRDGVRTTTQREYAVKLYNVTRFMDIGRLTAYLQEHIAGEFELEDMDSCTPNSSTSTVWKLTVKMAGCPEFLRGVVRIMWFGRIIILKHPDVGQRLQCLQCGNLGHPLARCRYTEEQLQGPGRRVATEQDVAELEDLAKPFASMEEVMETAAKRLQLQTETERKAQVAVTPSGIATDHPQEKQEVGPGEHLQGQQGRDRSQWPTHDSPLVEPQQKRPWVTVPLRGGRNLYAHTAALNRRSPTASSRFAELADDSDTDDEVEEVTEPTVAQPDIIEILSSDEHEQKAKPKITKQELAKLYLVKAKPKAMKSTPQLVALKQRERSTLRKLLESTNLQTGRRLVMTATEGEKIKDFHDVERVLGIRQVTTPPSGNCMAMALAQAAVDQDLAACDATLEEVTTSIKRGIMWSGFLNMSEQFDHYTRTQTLINVKRGWDGMSARESKTQFRWYLEQYGATPSSREAEIAGHNWGSSELMAMAANFLQQKIYVLAFNTDGKQQWHCSLYRPSTTTRGRKIFETGQQVPLTLAECLAAIQLDKKQEGQVPLVLHFWGKHYSAFVHTRSKEGGNGVSREQEEKNEENFELYRAPLAEQVKQTRCRPGSEKGASQEPWDPKLWNGDVEELRSRLDGMTIPHDLQREIYLILEKANPDRYAELLAFLVNTVSQLSHQERERILGMTLDAVDTDEARNLQQKYGIPYGVLQQWQQTIRDEQQELQQQHNDQLSSEAGESDSAYEPSDASSQDNKQLALTTTTHANSGKSKAQKRAHSTTPTEGEQIRQIMRTKLDQEAQHDTTTTMVDASPQELQTGFQATRDAWPDIWQQLGVYWPTTAQTAFPLERSSSEDWITASQSEPTRLVHIVQRFPFPEELMVSLSTKVLEAWTATWRRDCLYAKLVAYRSRTENKAIQRWLDDWKDKFTRPAPRKLAPLIDNSDDWLRLRNYGYGKDQVLRLCDVGNKARLAQHLLCAVIYEKEIRVLAGKEEETENGALTRLERHLDVLRKHEGYHNAYYSTKHFIDWFSVARFFSAALEHGEIERMRQD